MDHPSAPGAPLALASTLTPFPAWVMIAGLVVLPVGMALSFFVRRQAVVAFRGEIAVYELSFWRLRQVGEIVRFSPGEKQVSLRGLRLRIDGRTHHLEPGWKSNAARIVSIAGRASG